MLITCNISRIRNLLKKWNVLQVNLKSLRIEIGGTRMSLYDVIMGYVQDDFDERGIDFDVPEYNSVRSPKAVVKDMMAKIFGKISG